MSLADEAEFIVARLHRAYPRWPSTFQACPECGQHLGRGGDICAYCLTDQLAELVGEDIAKTYHATLIANSKAWSAILDRCEQADIERAKAVRTKPARYPRLPKRNKTNKDE